MAKFELKLPKMGESVAEATITNWLKEVGYHIEVDEAVFEIATDKVDSEVPSEVEGVLVEKLFVADDVVKVGQTVAIIETKGEGGEKPEVSDDEANEEILEAAKVAEDRVAEAREITSNDYSDSTRFYSPLVKNIAKEEGIGFDELEAIEGTGKDGRVTKNDILSYLQNRSANIPQQQKKEAPKPAAPAPAAAPSRPSISVSGEDEIIEMTRMGKMIAHHMVESVQTSAHVQSFIEVDVTNIWNWRKKNKDAF